MNFKERIKSIGPAAIVTAAFIGPGTVTTCSVAGAGFGYSLLWALVFSTIAVLILQEMSARLGIVSRKGLGEALRKQFQSRIPKFILIALVIAAIAFGCAAYQAGNIIGGALGLEGLTNIPASYCSITIGIVAFFILFRGKYKIVEKTLIGLVIAMSFSFIITAIAIKPNLLEILKGMFMPEFRSDSLYLSLGLIGTTVVPYNLFLHSVAVHKKWSDKNDLSKARSDLFFSIPVGGMISIMIVITAAGAFFGTGITLSNGADMAKQLEPVLGSWTKSIFSIGFFAAGMSSSITAPLAASYAVAGILGWEQDTRNMKLRMVWMVVLIAGIISSSLDFRPVQAIIFAQAANGLLLPIIAVFLLWVMNNKELLGEQRNRAFTNVLGFIVVLAALVLGVRGVFSAFGVS